MRAKRPGENGNRGEKTHGENGIRGEATRIRAECLKFLDQTTYILPVLQEEKCSSRRRYKKLY